MKIGEIYEFFSERLNTSLRVGQIVYVSYGNECEWMVKIKSIDGDHIIEEVLGSNGNLHDVTYEDTDNLNYGWVKLTSKYGKYV